MFSRDWIGRVYRYAVMGSRPFTIVNGDDGIITYRFTDELQARSCAAEIIARDFARGHIVPVR